MNFLGIGTGELLLVLVIILLVVGPERLPQLARQWAKFAKTLSQFTRTWQQFNAELNRQLTLEEMTEQRPRPAPAPLAQEPADNSIAPPELVQLAAASQPIAESAGALTEAADALDPTTLASPAAPLEEVQHEQ